MRVVFMGTPDFAVPALLALCAAGYEVTLVVTQPDKPQGRKKVLTPPIVKTVALEQHIPVYQPQSLKTEEAYERILAEKPACIVVAAYGKILPQRVLDLPQYGCVNIHGSLLPQYRGAAPIQWSILNGEKETGVTTMLMAAGIDTGDILLQEKTAIGAEETAGELFDRLAQLGASLLLKTLAALQNGTVQPVLQEEARASYVSVLTKEAATIDWNRPGSLI